MIRNISLVTVTYNSVQLASWFARTASNFEHVFIVDNASQDATRHAFLSFSPHAKLLSLDRNIGFGPANNVGFLAAREVSEFVIFINPDCHLNQADALQLVGILCKEFDVGIVFPVVTDACGNLPKLFLWDFSKPYKEKRLEPYDLSKSHSFTKAHVCLDGACFMVRTSDFLKIGGFNEDLFMYCEEDDLALRMQSIATKKTAICLTATATHIGGASTSRGTRLLIGRFYHARWSKLYMTDRYISRIQKNIKVFQDLLLTPVALVVYATLLKKAHIFKWLGWGAAAIDGAFMTKAFRRFFL